MTRRRQMESSSVWPAVSGSAGQSAQMDPHPLELSRRARVEGLPEPVEAFAVPWNETHIQLPAGSVAGRSPPLLPSVPQAAFVGRDGERAVMERSRSQARARLTRRWCCVSGEPRDGRGPPCILFGPWCRPARGFCLVGGVLGGAGGAVRAVDLGVLAATGRARALGGAPASRRTSMAASLRELARELLPTTTCHRRPSQRARIRRPIPPCSSLPVTRALRGVGSVEYPSPSCSTICTGRIASRWRCSSTSCRPPSPRRSR